MRDVYVTWANRTASIPDDGADQPAKSLTDLFLEVTPKELRKFTRVYYCNRYVISDEFREHELIPWVVAKLRGDERPMRYLDFDPKELAEKRNGRSLIERGQFHHEYSGTLGGLNMLKQAIHSLRTSDEDESILLLAGESLNPQRLERNARRRTLNHRAALATRDEEIGLTAISSHALLADAALRADPHIRTRQDVARLLRTVTLHREKYARLNPRAYQRLKPQPRLTREDYDKKEDTRDHKWPFVYLDICPFNVGASALVLANYPTNAKTNVRISEPCIVTGDVETPIIDRDGRRPVRTREKWVQTCNDIGYRYKGRDQRLILELFDTYGIQIPLTLIDIGSVAGRNFANLGDISKAFEAHFFDPLDDGALDPDGTKVVSTATIRLECRVLLNPSGGTKEGYTNGGYALTKAVELYWLLTGDRRAVLQLPENERPHHAILSVIGGAGGSIGFVGLVSEGAGNAATVESRARQRAEAGRGQSVASHGIHAHRPLRGRSRA